MRFFIAIATLACCGTVSAQSIDQIINPAEVERIEKVLSADDMQGRRTFTPAIDRAAAFIAGEFKQAGLQTLPGSSTYLQAFKLVHAKPLTARGILDGETIDDKNIITITTKESLSFNEKSGYEIVVIGATDTLRQIASRFYNGKKNMLVLIDTNNAKNFNDLKRFKRDASPVERSIVFVLTVATNKNSKPAHYSFDIQHEITERNLANVVGILPGKSKPNEYVIFSGHYDHLGIGKPNAQQDSIYNGANDDASGTTAVIMLAKYYKELSNNERTLVFATFTAEEIGGYGSQYFSQQFDPAKVMAMFNIEMIGTESKWGTNSAYITGYEKTDMGKILEKNLTGSNFTFYPDPYPAQGLFYRSDNATLARQGVAAHTISTSKMDSEKYYHTQGDEISTLDMNNMSQIIKAVATSAVSIINGTDTPSRVDTKQLR